MSRSVTILGIESSCDETAAAIVGVADSPTPPMLRRTSRKPIADSNRHFTFDIRSSVVSSQVRIHAKYGGVVPEVAAREHVLKIIPVIEKAFRNAHPLSLPLPKGGGEGRKNGTLSAIGFRLSAPIDAIAVTVGPGLITSLTVGVETARAIAFAWKKPLVAVNHIDGHILSALIEQRGEELESWRAGKLEKFHTRLEFPALALIVSGGHTELLLMRDWATYERIGATRDDAAGEAFDKVAKLLNLGYPGGPIIAKYANTGNPAAFAFPRGMAKSGDFDFSFSGLKTAVRYFIENHESRIMNQEFVNDICASFQQAVVDVLVAKTIAAARKHNARTILLGGGVAANRTLRMQLGHAISDFDPAIGYRLPAIGYTGDNATMIAAAGGIRFLLGERTSWRELDVRSNWELGI